MCLTWYDVVYVNDFISSSKSLCEGAGVIPIVEVEKLQLAWSCPVDTSLDSKMVLTPRPWSCSFYSHLCQPELASTEEGGLWLMHKAGGPGFACCEMDYGTGTVSGHAHLQVILYFFSRVL